MAEKTPKAVLCPYCGHTQTTQTELCEVCHGLFEPLSRRATQIAMGPWYVRDAAIPFRPGCNYETLVKQIEAGRIRPTTVLRGPTTRQFWSVARNVPGVAHLLGYCHHCNEKVKPEDKRCPACHEPFRPVTERNELGLQYATEAEASAALRLLEAEQRKLAAPTASVSGSEVEGGSAAPAKKAAPTMPGMDLLEEIIAPAARTAAEPPAANASRLLRMEPTPPPADKPQALDFAPSSDAVSPANTESPAAPAAPAGSSRTTWLLVTLNVLVLLLIVAVVMLRSGAPATPPATEALPEPPAPRLDPSPATPSPAAPSIFDEPVTPDAQAPQIDPRAIQTTVAQALAQARELESANRHDEALQLLRQLTAQLPSEQVPASLRAQVNRLETHQRQRRPATFFGIPIQ